MSIPWAVGELDGHPVVRSPANEPQMRVYRSTTSLFVAWGALQVALLGACEERKGARADGSAQASAPAQAASASAKVEPAPVKEASASAKAASASGQSTARPSEKKDTPEAVGAAAVKTEKVTPSEFCRREEQRERELLQGKKFFESFTRSCVTDKNVAWTKRLTAVFPGEVEEYRFDFVRYENGEELRDGDHTDGEFTTTGPLLLFDALGDEAKEVFWTDRHDGPEGDSWTHLRGLGVEKGRLVRIQSRARRLDLNAPGGPSVVVDTTLQDLRFNCESVHGSINAPGLELRFRPSGSHPPAFALDRKALAAWVKKRCPTDSKVVAYYGDAVDERRTNFLAHCALAKGRSLKELQSTLQSSCELAPYRESCETPRPPKTCDNWTAIVDSLTPLSTFLQKSGPPPLFSFEKESAP